MKWAESQVTKLYITQLEELDPVTVYLENYGGGAGKLTIEVWGDCWSHYWSAMGDRSLEQFVLGADNHYLSKKLATLSALSEPDYEGFVERQKRFILEERRDGGFTKSEARRLWEMAKYIEPSEEYFHDGHNHDLLHEVAGDDWWYDIPDKDSHLYTYLCLILDAVKDCLRERESLRRDAA